MKVFLSRPFLVPIRTVLALMFFVFSFAAQAEALDPEVKALLPEKFKLLKTWAAEPILVKATKNANQASSAEAKAMTQEAWEKGSVLDPFVRSLSKNEAGAFLKKQKDANADLSEAFLSAADGTKVALLAKTSSWSHKGKPKHDKPMAGQDWTGDVEVDKSSGQKQVQISVPVMDGSKVIGSLVAGFSILKIQKK